MNHAVASAQAAWQTGAVTVPGFASPPPGVPGTAEGVDAPTSVAALGRPLGRGWSGEVYAYGPGRVVKLLRAGLPRGAAERQASLGEVVHRAGIPAPAVHGVVGIEGRFGVLFERVDGPTMLDVIKARPWLVLRFAALLGELHARIHRAPVAPDAGLGRLADQLRRRIERVASLSDAARAAALDQLSRLDRRPGEPRLCHGDLHPGNVVLGPRGPVIVDWGGAALGPPAADVARTQLLILYGKTRPLVGGPKRLLLPPLRRALFALPVRRYVARTGLDEREVAEWRLPVITGRMADFAPRP